MFTMENNFTEYPDILNIPQCREILHVGKSTIYTLLQTNEIKSIKIGRDYKIPKESVIDYLNNKISA